MDKESVGYETDLLVACDKAGYGWLFSLKPKGLISTQAETKPFYTSVTNPFNITLNKDQCQNIIWWVNATGSKGSYEFFAYANLTLDVSVSNKTDKINVTII